MCWRWRLKVPLLVLVVVVAGLVGVVEGRTTTTTTTTTTTDEDGDALAAAAAAAAGRKLPLESRLQYARTIASSILSRTPPGARLIGARGELPPLVSRLVQNASSIRHNIVDTFSCSGRVYGYYADQDNDCQIFHICVPMNQLFPDLFEPHDVFHFSFVCPGYTIFTQDAMVCAWVDFAFPCSMAHQLYHRNNHFFVVPAEDVPRNTDSDDAAQNDPSPSNPSPSNPSSSSSSSPTPSPSSSRVASPPPSGTPSETTTTTLSAPRTPSSSSSPSRAASRRDRFRASRYTASPRSSYINRLRGRAATTSSTDATTTTTTPTTSTLPSDTASSPDTMTTTASTNTLPPDPTTTEQTHAPIPTEPPTTLPSKTMAWQRI